MADFKFNINKFENVIVLTMTPDTAGELLESLLDDEELDNIRPMDALRRALRAVLNYKGRNTTNNRRPLLPIQDVRPQPAGDTST